MSTPQEAITLTTTSTDRRERLTRKLRPRKSTISFANELYRRFGATRRAGWAGNGAFAMAALWLAYKLNESRTEKGKRKTPTATEMLEAAVMPAVTPKLLILAERKLCIALDYKLQPRGAWR